MLYGFNALVTFGKAVILFYFVKRNALGPLPLKVFFRQLNTQLLLCFRLFYPHKVFLCIVYII